MNCCSVIDMILRTILQRVPGPVAAVGNLRALNQKTLAGTVSRILKWRSDFDCQKFEAANRLLREHLESGPMRRCQCLSMSKRRSVRSASPRYGVFFDLAVFPPQPAGPRYGAACTFRQASGEAFP